MPNGDQQNGRDVSQYHGGSMGGTMSGAGYQPGARFIEEHRAARRQQDATRVQKGIDADAREARMHFISAVEKAAAKNEQEYKKTGHYPLEPSAFPAIVRVYEEEFPKLKADIERAYAQGPDRATIAANRDDAKRAAYERLDRRISVIKDGKEAWQAAGQADQSGGFIENAVKKVYDTDRGGVQWGGLLTGLLGGGALYMATAGSGTLINVIATIIGVAGAAYLGDRFFDKKPEPLKTPDFHSRIPSGQSLSPKVTVEPNQQKDMGEILKNSKGKHASAFGHDPIEVGDLTPAQTPVIVPKDAKGQPIDAPKER